MNALCWRQSRLQHIHYFTRITRTRSGQLSSSLRMSTSRWTRQVLCGSVQSSPTSPNAITPGSLSSSLILEKLSSVAWMETNGDLEAFSICDDARVGLWVTTDLHPSCHSKRDPRFSAHQYRRGILNGDTLASLHQAENQTIHMEVGVYTSYRFGHAGDRGLLLKMDFTDFNPSFRLVLCSSRRGHGYGMVWYASRY